MIKKCWCCGKEFYAENSCYVICNECAGLNLIKMIHNLIEEKNDYKEINNENS